MGSDGLSDIKCEGDGLWVLMVYLTLSERVMVCGF